MLHANYDTGNANSEYPSLAPRNKRSTCPQKVSSKSGKRVVDIAFDQG
jgi:hypothetical protein